MPVFLTYAEVANRLRVPVATVRYWVHIGRLPAFKVGRSPIVRESDLLTLVEGSQIGAARRKAVAR